MLKTVDVKMSPEKLAEVLGVKIGVTFKVGWQDDSGDMYGHCVVMDNGQVVVFWDSGTAEVLDAYDVGTLMEKKLVGHGFFKAS